ncbi:MAG: alkaline phosphatase family protein [Oscillospiraceae bacterium]|nr:alkaline phosphatase family protein [Oscillospiraceae bacterium]
MKKAMFIGIDGAISKLIRKFDAEGAIPNLSALMRRGVYTDMLSQIPVATPINWASLSTGAVPGVHNVVGFWCHTKGERVDRYTHENAFTNSFVAAERIWEAVERQGGRSVVMKFPGSWPASVKTGCQVDGYCIPSYNQSILDVAGNGCHSVQDLHLSTRICLRPAEGWANVDFPVRAETEILLPLKRGLGQLRYFALVCGQKGYEQILLSESRDAAKAFACLKPGDWSAWHKATLGEDLETALCFKLISLSPDGEDLRLYHSQLYPSRGFTKPDALGPRLQERFGPMIEFASPHAWKYGWTDLETCYEEAEYQVEWMSRASELLLTEEPWNFYITQFHWVDHVQHYFLPLVDPVAPSYRKEGEEAAWNVIRQAYALADRYVGELVKLTDEDTAVFVLSDHGNICDEYTVSLLPYFIREGFIAMKTDGLGKKQIDWSRTVAYPCKPGNADVYINLKGRDEEGCVEPEDYEAIRTKVISALRELEAPDGRKVFDLVLRKEDAVPLGIYGDYAGDIIAVYAQGFSWAGHGGEEWDREDSIFEISTTEGFDYGAHHGPMMPTAETEVCSNKAFLAAAGSGIRSGYDRLATKLGPVRVIDVAPTICQALGCYPPRQSQGSVIGDFMADQAD